MISVVEDPIPKIVEDQNSMFSKLSKTIQTVKILKLIALGALLVATIFGVLFIVQTIYMKLKLKKVPTKTEMEEINHGHPKTSLPLLPITLR